MKFLLIALLLPSAALAGMNTKFFSHTIKADTELELIEKAENAIPLIRSGKIKDVFQSGCWPNNNRTIKVKSLSIKKYYSVQEDNSLVPYYQGSIRYLHKRCRESNR